MSRVVVVRNRLKLQKQAVSVVILAIKHPRLAYSNYEIILLFLTGHCPNICYNLYFPKTVSDPESHTFINMSFKMRTLYFMRGQ